MNTLEIKKIILANAEEVVRLHGRVHDTWRDRESSPEACKMWFEAAQEFRTRYDSLAFPGGYEGALKRLLEGDLPTIEAAISFLELRPYFFRSGYMFKDLLRMCRKAPLSAEQRFRFERVEAAVQQWRNQKLAAARVRLHPVEVSR